MTKLNEMFEAGTDATIPTNVQVNHVSQTIAKLHYLDVSLINKEAIEFADYLLGNFEMSEFEKEHPKYKVDDELCWQLAGTKQKYTSKEMYEMFISEKKIKTAWCRKMAISPMLNEAN